MDSWNGIDDIGFDMKKVTKAVEHYSRSTGIKCSIIDTYGKTLYTVDCSPNSCDFCSKARHALNADEDYCAKVHLYGSYQAERFGGKYIFFCPLGLVHWASPITAEGMMRAAVLCGPVLMVEPEEFLIEDIIRDKIKECNLEELKREILNVPVIPPDRVTSLSELLFMVTCHISDIEHLQYMEQSEYQEHQSNISEYIHHLKTMGGEVSEVPAYPIEKERELLSRISMGDKKGSQKVLNEILGYIFFSTGGDFEVIKARVLELIVLLSRAALEGGADIEEIFGLNFKYLNAIHRFETVDELTYWLSKIMVRFTDCVFNLNAVKHADVIYKAMDYVRRNYMKKITLEDVASYVHLSPSYFSKIFKDEMKCNFNTYVNQVRIEMSKKLLLDTSISLVDVSNIVGYEDQSYFSKVFKKMVGVSPGKFREGRGQYIIKEAEV